MCGQSRPDRRKHTAGNPFLFEFFRVIRRQKRYRTGTVIHETHFNAFGCLSFEHFQHPIPHVAFRYNKILHENKFLCFFQLTDQFFNLIFPTAEVFDAGVFICRKSAVFTDIMCQRCDLRIFFFELLLHSFILCPVFLRRFVHVLQPCIEPPHSDLKLHKNIEQHTKHRCHQHDRHPYHLKSRIAPIIC